MQTNIDTIVGIYEAFGRGDVEHILGQLNDDVSWDEGIRQTDLPYLQPRRGKAEVMDFFQALAQNIEFTTFEPQAPCASADTVMVAVREVGRNLVTGAPIPEDLSVHIWRFGTDGKVSSFRHVLDLATHEKAAAPTSTTASAS
ncbi:MAG: nuclear transport factor 2 family protein [Acidimicrobiales bacterium]